jgi:hypothetical protein
MYVELRAYGMIVDVVQCSLCVGEDGRSGGGGGVEWRVADSALACKVDRVDSLADHV